MSWGTELWDRYEDLSSLTNTGIDFVEKYVTEFIKERGKVEREYARKLRDLVRKYTPPPDANAKKRQNDSRKDKSGPPSINFKCGLQDEEFSHVVAYREVS